MIASRLRVLATIGVDQMGALADRVENKSVLRLENLATDLRPPARVIAVTKQEVDLDRLPSVRRYQRIARSGGDGPS
jgi:hypothetical protein